MFHHYYQVQYDLLWIFYHFFDISLIGEVFFYYLTIQNNLLQNIAKLLLNSFLFLFNLTHFLLLNLFMIFLQLFSLGSSSFLNKPYSLSEHLHFYFRQIRINQLTQSFFENLRISFYLNDLLHNITSFFIEELHYRLVLGPWIFFERLELNRF